MGNRLKQTAIALLATVPVLPAMAQDTPDPYSALATDTRPISSRWQTDYSGSIEAGLAYVSEDNFMFGQYNGLYEKGANFIGNVDWRGWSGDSKQYWQVDARDLGLETRRGKLEWGRAGLQRVALVFDSQLQVKNDSARTPFIGAGSGNLMLPGDWVGGANTSDWPQLYPSLQNFDRKLERHQYGLQFDTVLGAGWSLQSAFSSEQKQGTSDIGGAIYNDASGPLAALLPQTVDQRTTEFDLAFGYQGSTLFFNASYHFADFSNNEDMLLWQNPYVAGFGPVVDYPSGTGGMALAPDNQYQQLRLTGTWVLSPALRLQMDGSYGRARQSDDYAAYTVNPGLVVEQAVARSDLDGQVDTTMLALGFHARATRKLTLEARYRYNDRNNNSPRDGYLYVRGDGANQPAAKYSAYNAPHDTRKQTMILDGSYRLPKRTKLTLEYVY